MLKLELVLGLELELGLGLGLELELELELGWFRLRCPRAVGSGFRLGCTCTGV